MSGGGGGVIIIRRAMRTTLKDPMVHGALPEHMQAVIDPILARDPDTWTLEEHRIISHAFNWAAEHC